VEDMLQMVGCSSAFKGCSNLVLEQGVSSLNLLTWQMTRFETLEVLEARRKITRELTCLYHAANVVSPPRLLPVILFSNTPSILSNRVTN